MHILTSGERLGGRLHKEARSNAEPHVAKEACAEAFFLFPSPSPSFDKDNNLDNILRVILIVNDHLCYVRHACHPSLVLSGNPQLSSTQALLYLPGALLILLSGLLLEQQQLR